MTDTLHPYLLTFSATLANWKLDSISKLIKESHNTSELVKLQKQFNKLYNEYKSISPNFIHNYDKPLFYTYIP
jgi:hypothetical protein